MRQRNWALHVHDAGKVQGNMGFVLLQVWVYRCIQELMFLQQRISRHPFYAQAKAALQADPSRPLLVPPSMLFAVLIVICLLLQRLLMEGICQISELVPSL